MTEKKKYKIMTHKGLQIFEEPIALDLGCGRNKYQPWYKGIDISKAVNPDICMDFTVTPLPFPDMSVDTIYTSHTLEHITGRQLIFLMNECWRVLKWTDDKSDYEDTGKMWIHVPHKDCILAWQDPTHRNYFVEDSFKFFCGEYLTKHKLDYGIEAIFWQNNPRKYFPQSCKDDRGEKYCKMIEFLLLKDYDHYIKYVGKFPLNKKEQKDEKSEKLLKDINDKWFDTTNYKTDHNNHFNNELKNIAKHAINKHLKEILEIKIDATNRYGIQFAPRGKEGLMHDIYRKLVRTYNHYEAGESLTSENIKDTLRDGAVYFVLALLYEEEMEKRRLRGDEE